MNRRCKRFNKQTQLSRIFVVLSLSRPLHPATYVKTAGLAALRITLFLILFLAPATRSQQPSNTNSPEQTPANNALPNPPVNTAGLYVHVREPGGTPLTHKATVKLSTPDGAQITEHTQDGSIAIFSRVVAGEYEMQVSAEGYKTAKEHVTAFPNGTPTTVYVYLHSEAEAFSANAVDDAPIMSPHLRSEVEKGLDKMRRQQYDAARAQFEKAVKLAPGNPDVHYLLGMVEYAQQHYDAARAKFQTALAIYPSHERALVALGELELRTGDSVGATATLEKAYATNGADWRTHFLLARAYLAQRNLDEALTHARRAAAIGKEQAASAWMLVGQILVQMKRPDQAKETFTKVIHNFPQDEAAPEAKVQLAALTKRTSSGPRIASDPPVTATAPVAEPAFVAGAANPVRAWAPPDTDHKEYELQDATCSQDEVLESAQSRIERQLANFEKFVATEHIEHQQVDEYGFPQQSRSKDFNYIVLVEHPREGVSFLNEWRDGGESLSSFPTPLATQGLFALALSVFGPNFRNDLSYRCEGLGAWRGQEAWQVRFEQKADMPPRIRLWREGPKLRGLALKGRAWISASTYDVLHIETDLVQPVPEFHLTRDHLVIDYGPVDFAHNQTTLWLPWGAEMFMEVHGKRYHHIHTLRNYLLFSVDTAYTVGQPKQGTQADPAGEN